MSPPPGGPRRPPEPYPIEKGRLRRITPGGRDGKTGRGPNRPARSPAPSAALSRNRTLGWLPVPRGPVTRPMWLRPQNCTHCCCTSRASRLNGGDASPTLMNQSTSAASSSACQQTVPFARASASHRSNRRLSRSPAVGAQKRAVSRTDQPGPIRPRRQAGPGVDANDGLDPKSVCSGRARDRHRTAVWRRSRALSSIAGPPAATAHCESATSPRPSSA